MNGKGTIDTNKHVDQSLSTNNKIRDRRRERDTVKTLVEA